MKPYDPKSIEPKWQKIWNETGLYKTDEDPQKENYYCLTMFPYPSGDLHTGHWYAYSGPDIVARWNRMSGKNVLHPMGFDAFGLNAENAAIKRNIPPAKWTGQNIANMTRQLHDLGAMYDWDRVIDTSKPEYYKWTQWLFLKLYAMGLAYRQKGWQNWCPKDKTVLANEQVVGENNVCERCGTPVIKKELEQWFFKITEYAERLLKDLEDLDWPKRVKVMQQNWIGRSEGIDIDFPFDSGKETMTVFTKFSETIFGVTFMIVAPEHPLVSKLTSAEHKKEVEAYIKETSGKTNLDRLEDGKTKTGVFTGGYVINPVNKQKVPVWIADYVLMDYGTGAVMGVPGHDERDFEFAKKYDLPIVRVVGKSASDKSAIEKPGDVIEDGVLVNSGELNGLKAHKPADTEAMNWLQKKKFGKKVTNYRLRDWLISRQRYWGAPIPIVYCDKDGIVPVPAKDLPVLLPEDVEFKPTGQSPLVDIADFVNTTCPKCGGPAKRETDTMDTFVDSSWYYLRFPNPRYDESPFDPKEVKKWLPVKHYLGGIEHAILHLLYSRFITKALFDAKMVDFEEPFLKLSNQGIILGPDGQKMSKSRGNVVNPDEQVAAYGADTFRAYLMFTGPWKDGGPFDVKGIAGLRRFLERVWVLTREFIQEKDQKIEAIDNQAELETKLDFLSNKTTKQVTADIEETAFNTAIAALMELTNGFYKVRAELPLGASAQIWQHNLESLLKLLAPIAPHMTEELWHELGNEQSIHVQDWPAWDDKLIKEEVVTIVVQVNGKVRANLTAAPRTPAVKVVEQAKKDSNVQTYLKQCKLIKTITVPDKLVNFVVQPRRK